MVQSGEAVHHEDGVRVLLEPVDGLLDDAALTLGVAPQATPQGVAAAGVYDARSPDDVAANT